MATTKPKTKSAKSTDKLRPVLVTTLHRGIFFGFTSAKDGDETVRLGKCRGSGSRDIISSPTETV